MKITADHESVVMQQIRRERFRQFCEGFGSLRSPWSERATGLTHTVWCWTKVGLFRGSSGHTPKQTTRLDDAMEPLPWADTPDPLHGAGTRRANV